MMYVVIGKPDTSSRVTYYSTACADFSQAVLDAPVSFVTMSYPLLALMRMTFDVMSLPTDCKGFQ